MNRAHGSTCAGVLKIAAVLLGALGVPRAETAAANASRPPDIVLIVADNLGHGDLGCYGCTDIRTPNIDRLAAEGVRFTNFYSNGPECTPTRTALFTGRYQQRVGGLECALGSGNVGRYDDAIALAARHQLGLPPEEAILVPLLKTAGYRAVGLGKWHLGYEKQFLPPRHGFDYFLASLGGTIDEYLFDLSVDPSENTNLIDSRSADAARLKQRLANWETGVRGKGVRNLY